MPRRDWNAVLRNRSKAVNRKQRKTFKPGVDHDPELESETRFDFDEPESDHGYNDDLVDAAITRWRESIFDEARY